MCLISIQCSSVPALWSITSHADQTWSLLCGVFLVGVEDMTYERAGERGQNCWKLMYWSVEIMAAKCSEC